MQADLLIYPRIGWDRRIQNSPKLWNYVFLIVPILVDSLTCSRPIGYTTNSLKELCSSVGYYKNGRRKYCEQQEKQHKSSCQKT